VPSGFIGNIVPAFMPEGTIYRLELSNVELAISRKRFCLCACYKIRLAVMYVM
jgi:hypothetical protein